MENAAINVTQGRQIIEPGVLTAKMKAILREAADYLDEPM